MATTTGECYYCGKIQMIETSGNLTPEQANRLVTARCDCEEARRYRAAEDIDDAVKSIMANDEGEINQQVADALIQLANAIMTELVTDATITLTDGDKVKINRRKRALAIVRTHKRERMEVVQ